MGGTLTIVNEETVSFEYSGVVFISDDGKVRKSEGMKGQVMIPIKHCLGSLNTTLGSAGLIGAPLDLLYNDFAVMIGLVYGELPFMILPIYASLEKLDLTLLEIPSLRAAVLGGFVYRCGIGAMPFLLPLLLQLGFGLRQLGAVRTRIDHEQQVAFVHDAAFGEVDALDVAGHARADFDALDRFEAAGELVPLGDVALQRCGHRNLGELRGRRRRRFALAAGDTCERSEAERGTQRNERDGRTTAKDTRHGRLPERSDRARGCSARSPL